MASVSFVDMYCSVIDAFPTLLELVGPYVARRHFAEETATGETDIVEVPAADPLIVAGGKLRLTSCANVWILETTNRTAHYCATVNVYDADTRRLVLAAAVRGTAPELRDAAGKQVLQFDTDAISDMFTQSEQHRLLPLVRGGVNGQSALAVGMPQLETEEIQNAALLQLAALLVRAQTQRRNRICQASMISTARARVGGAWVDAVAAVMPDQAAAKQRTFALLFLANSTAVLHADLAPPGYVLSHWQLPQTAAAVVPRAEAFLHAGLFPAAAQLPTDQVITADPDVAELITRVAAHACPHSRTPELGTPMRLQSANGLDARRAVLHRVQMSSPEATAAAAGAAGMLPAAERFDQTYFITLIDTGILAGVLRVRDIPDTLAQHALLAAFSDQDTAQTSRSFFMH